MLLVLPALAPLARPGFFESHDGLLHAYRLAALDQAVRSGVLYPRWFPEFAFGYGQPVLNFYGPLSYYLGLPFTLVGIGLLPALKLVFACGLIASALGMYAFARLHLSRGPAVVAAVVYAYLPYRLIDLYIRGALAEHLVFVWFPLVLWAFHAVLHGPARRSPARIALAVLLMAALILTHNLSAMIFAPLLVAYVVILLLAARSDPPLGRSVLALVVVLILAALLTSFYWLPVLAESQYVGLGHSASQGYRDHLLPWLDLSSLSPTYPYPTAPGVVPPFRLGLLQWAVLLGATVLLVLPRSRRWPAIFFLFVAYLSAFMLTTASLPVWKTFEPALAFLQYPWRFQALTALATAFLAGALVQGLSRPSLWSRFAPGPLLVMAIALWALWRLPFTSLRPDLTVEEMWRQDHHFGQIGATWTGEYLPIWVTEQRWAISHPAAESVPDSGARPAGELELNGIAYTRHDFAVDSLQPVHLVLHQFYYPGWDARWQGRSYAAHPEGVLGLAAFDLPAGSGPLTVRLRLTPAQKWGCYLSLATALLIAIALCAYPQHSGPGTARRRLLQRGGTRLLGLAACSLLLAGILLAGLIWPNGRVRPVQQVSANLEDTVELLGSFTNRPRYRAGQTVDVTVYWLALRSLDKDYKAFVHLTDAAMTRQPAQHDGDPGGGFTPVSRWLPGEILPDTHHLSLPADLLPGRYLLWGGMYDFETVQNLRVLSASVPSSDNRVLLGEIEVLAP